MNRPFQPTLRIINARLADKENATLWIEDGKFVSAPSSAQYQTVDLQGAMVLPGLVETHIHLDKACIMSRCDLQQGTLSEAVEQTRQAKRDFTEEDVYQRRRKRAA
ncbi:amidohydrolase family protein [Ewingella americana]